MKLWKKILLLLLAILLLAQIPFIYRRYQIGQFAGKISNLDAQKGEISNPSFKEYKGAIHVHTSIGGHSAGGFNDLIEAAKKNNLDFVVMTEHAAESFDTSALTLNGTYGGVLFVGGQETGTKSGDRFLLVPGSGDSFQSAELETPQFLEKYRSQNRLALVAHPENLKTRNSDFDAVEVFNLDSNSKKMNPFFAFFDLIWSFPAYPELTVARYFQRPNESLQKFDEISRQTKSALFAGSDAHSNIGFQLFGDDAGNKIINIKIDRYETIFRLVRQHVLLEKDKPLTQANLLDALKKGHAFIGFDALSDTSGFFFAAENGAESKIQGDEIALTAQGVKLKAIAPQAARFVFFKNGEKIFESGEGNTAEFQAKEKGVYRTEVYLNSLGSPFDKTPWIISNPIYVK